MYNRYLSTAYEERGRPEPQDIHMPEPPAEEAAEPSFAPPHRSKPQAESNGLLSGLSEALTGRLQNLHFDIDTLVIIIAVYFLLADTEDFDTDLLILIGVMFILGF